MTPEEKFDKAHEILQEAAVELKKIGFTRYALVASRPESWLDKHNSIADNGIAATIYGSAREIITGMAYMYGMMCEDSSKKERKFLRDFVDDSFDAFSRLGQEEGEEIAINQIKISKAKAKDMTVEELIKTALKQTVDEDGDED